MDEFTTPPSPLQAATLVRPGTAAWARVGLLGIAAAAILAAAIVAFGAAAQPNGTLAAGTSSGVNDSPLVIDLNGLGRPGDRGGFGHGMGAVEITAISGSSISLKTVDGWTRTITVDADTTYSKSGDTIALGDLAVGDDIAFKQTLEDDGSWTIDAIAVIPPRVGGEVTAVSGSTITVEGRDGTSATIKVTADTDYQVDGDDAALADVKVGMFLVAEGTENADGSLTATDVRAADPDSFPGRGGHGFKFGPGPGGPWGDKPDATTAPSATGSAG
jgi:hypothetical protein